jgi:predicted negative regulator of RcsB-dependent stress response
MKAQRRHELQHNVLDAELAKGVEFIRQRRTYIVWGVVLAALAILAVTYTIRSTHNKARSLQARYDHLISSSAVTPQQFLDGMKSLAESSGGQLAALATIQVGKFYAAQFSAAGGESSDPRQRDLSDQAAA